MSTSRRRAEGVYRARQRDADARRQSSDAARDWTHLETLLALGAAGRVARPGSRLASRPGRDRSARDPSRPSLDSPGSIAASRRRFVLGWDARRDAPAALLDARATPDDVIAAALAAVHAAETRNSRNRGGGTAGVTSVGEMDAATAEAAYAYADRRAGEFAEAMRAAGWRTDFVQMGTAPKYRLDALGNAGEEGRVKETDE